MVENNHEKLLIQPPEPVSKLKIKFLPVVTLITKEVGLVAVISWLEGISPAFIFRRKSDRTTQK